MSQQTKRVRIDLRTTEKTEAQLEELQRILSGQLGTKISKTATVEIAIDRLLQSYAANPEQARLI